MRQRAFLQLHYWTRSKEANESVKRNHHNGRWRTTVPSWNEPLLLIWPVVIGRQAGVSPSHLHRTLFITSVQAQHSQCFWESSLFRRNTFWKNTAWCWSVRLKPDIYVHVFADNCFHVAQTIFGKNFFFNTVILAHVLLYIIEGEEFKSHTCSPPPGGDQGVFASLLWSPHVVYVYIQVDCLLTSGAITVAGQESFRPGLQTPAATFSYYRWLG